MQKLLQQPVFNTYGTITVVTGIKREQETRKFKPWQSPGRGPSPGRPGPAGWCWRAGAWGGDTGTKHTVTLILKKALFQSPRHGLPNQFRFSLLRQHFFLGREVGGGRLWCFYFYQRRLFCGWRKKFFDELLFASPELMSWVGTVEYKVESGILESSDFSWRGTWCHNNL